MREYAWFATFLRGNNDGNILTFQLLFYTLYKGSVTQYVTHHNHCISLESISQFSLKPKSNLMPCLEGEKPYKKERDDNIFFPIFSTLHFIQE